MVTPPHPTRRLAPPLHRGVAIALAIALGVPLLFLIAGSAYFWSLTGEFAEHRPAQPSRLYGAPVVLANGAAVDATGLTASLGALGYRRVATRPRGGEFRLRDGTLEVGVRGSGVQVAEAPAELAGRRVRARLAERRLTDLAVDGRPLGARGSVDLGRPLLYSYYDASMRESRPARLEELPEHVVQAILAAEDAKFFRHSGVAPAGIVRAAWQNLRAHEVRQGGSTITQQLVKNLYLDPRRSYARKAREALLAVLLEARFPKEAILSAYLDEIYWGSVDGVNLHGIGAASRAYFDKEPHELSLGEAATLAGMIPSPGAYSPLTAPDASRQRRDWVLGRMQARGWLSAERAALARTTPLEPRRGELRARRAPYFAMAAAAEAERRFDLDSVAGSGHRLFSTLSLADQQAAEREVRAGLQGLERDLPRSASGALQAALVSLDPRDGRVLAWVGGRDWSTSQFDRVAHARRQAGSAFKPMVYAAAFASGRLEPWELLRDTPIKVRYDRTDWRPRNSDGAFHGEVTARQAMELSLNVPAVRIAMRTGLDSVRETAREMGISSPLPAVPALALGACEVTPLEIGVAYGTLAAGGRRPAPWALERILDATGEELEGDEVAAPVRVLDADVAYLLTSMLRGVVDHGTAWRARELGARGPLAGKTGTTDDGRDSWFAGYSADRVTVVWVGYDANHPTRLTGSRGALPLWSRFVARVTPAAGFQAVPRPAGFVTVDLDPSTGLLATPFCPRHAREELPAGMAPLRRCDRHAPTSPLAFASPWGGAPAYGPVHGSHEDATLGDALARRQGDQPPVRLRGDVTEMFGRGADIQVGAGAQPAPATGGGTIEVGGRRIEVGGRARVRPLGPGEVEIHAPPAAPAGAAGRTPSPLVDAAAGAARDRR